MNIDAKILNKILIKQIQEYENKKQTNKNKKQKQKLIIHHDQVGYLSGMQGDISSM
jgi:tmRNA-binding protein